MREDTEEALKSLSPMEILEAVALEEDPDGLVDALAEYIDAAERRVRSSLVSLGVLDEGEEDHEV